MASIQELKDARLLKLKKLEELGINPYPANVPCDFELSYLKENFEKLELESQSSNKEFSIVGRVMAIRGQGAILFAVLKEGNTEFQAVIQKDKMVESNNEKGFDLFVDVVDIGDFISVTGTLFTTKRGERSLQVNSWVMATKSLLPLPEKWHGLTDNDERFRMRYLDIATDTDVYDIFIKKAKFWNVTRNYLMDKGFLEVETPTLEVTTGGAEANPFKTHHDDYDLDVYLRISVGELWQKRLMAAGFPKTFEIGRVYRNEGSSPEHLQEFTNMEFYMAYADYNDGMKLVEDMYKKIAVEVFGKTEFTTRGHAFDFANSWPKISYRDEVLKQTDIDIDIASEKEMKDKLDELEVKYEGDNKERLMDTLWKFCRKNIAGPAFLIHHPKLVSPLAKAKEDNNNVVERFQVIIAGSEVGNGFSELNDPIDQRARFELQQQLIDRGDKEAMMPEWEFVEMLEHGMPPTCGFGFGERLFSFLVDKPIRETQLFPLMRPKKEE